MFPFIFSVLTSVLLVFSVLMHLCISRRIVNQLEEGAGTTIKAGFFLGRPKDTRELYVEGVDRIVLVSHVALVTSGVLLLILLIPAGQWMIWMITGLAEYAYRPFVDSGVFFLLGGGALLVLSILLIGHFAVLYQRMAASG